MRHLPQHHAGNDVDVLEIDGASNTGIDNIRELRQNATCVPGRSRFKIYIIDEVHMLSTAAFNGLLKTLEEPPEHVKFMFCTTEARKIPITILSRCQRFDFAGFPRARSLTACGRSSRRKALKPRTRRWKCSPGVRPARCATANRSWSNSSLRSRADHCGRCSQYARHRGRSAAGGM